jgi:hypothetical protein
MPTKKKLSVTLSPVVTAVIRPVATRLNRIDNLLIEMRGVLDFHVNRIGALRKQVDILIEKDRVRIGPSVRMSSPNRAPSPCRPTWTLMFADLRSRRITPCSCAFQRFGHLTGDRQGVADGERPRESGRTRVTSTRRG